MRIRFSAGGWRFAGKWLLTSGLVIAGGVLGFAATANFGAQVHGHITRAEGQCPDGAAKEKGVRA